MARFASNYNSEGDAIGALADQLVATTSRNYAAKTVTTHYTLTVGEMINGIVKEAGTPGAHNVTTPTAAQIVAAIKNCQVGSAFEFVLMNTSDNTATIVAGTTVTLVGVTAVPTNKTQVYRGVVTAIDTPAVSLIGLLYAPV